MVESSFLFLQKKELLLEEAKPNEMDLKEKREGERGRKEEVIREQSSWVTKFGRWIQVVKHSK